MQAVEFNEWDFYPVNLKSDEVNHPISVFKAFFCDDWLPDQLERLKVWRDYVLKNEYYLDNKKSPFGLLHFYNLNICLLEAAHLLKEAGGLPDCVRNTEAFTHEKETWRDYPSNLKSVELLNPNLVIAEFFETYNLPQYRAHLYEWLEYGLSTKAANEFIETSDLIRVYENLQKLYSAAWLIHQRVSDNPYLKGQTANDLTVNQYANIEFKTPALDNVKVYPLNQVIPASYEELISKLIAIIKHKVQTVQAIIFLGTCPDSSETIFLLVLTSNDEQRQAQALSSTIEESCNAMARIVPLVHHASIMLTALGNDNLFFNAALSCPVIYLSGDLLLPVANPLSHCKSYEVQTLKWERWHSQGKDFLSGAEYYLKTKAYGACIFSLHQCAECFLIALIRAILGYRVNNHNLSKLLNISQMFTADLATVFNLGDPESAQLFDLLKHAYVNVRYKDNFEPDAKAVTRLYQITKHFVDVTKMVYEKHLLNGSL